MRSLTVTSGNSTGMSGGRAAFSLVEVMIAIGILGIGMTMIAAIFPAAIRENEISTNSTLGKIICENGLTLGRLALTADVGNNGTASSDPAIPSEVYSDMLKVFANEGKTDVLDIGAQHYPYGENESRLGFVLLARKANKGYQLVTVAYRKAEAAGTVTAKSITCKVISTTITNASGAELRVGSPLIDRITGKYATIVATNPDGTTGTLDQLIGTAGTSGYYVIIETKQGQVGKRSPAIATIATHTGLRP